MISLRIKIFAIFSVLILTIVMWLSMGEGWPPYHQELSLNFKANRDAFDRLEEKILQTEFVHVSTTGIYGIPRFNDSKHVVAETQGDEFRESEIIENDSEWDDLFVELNVFGVSHFDDVVSMTFIGPLQREKRTVYAEYVHSQESLDERIECLPEHQSLGCGLCAFSLSDGWFIEYWWSPETIVPGGYDLVLDGELSEEEYRDQFSRLLTECRRDGYKAIGYEMSLWPAENDSES